MKIKKIKDLFTGKLPIKPVEDKRKLTKLLESHNFDLFIISVILLDALILGLMASDIFGYADGHLLADHFMSYETYKSSGALINDNINFVLLLLDRLFMGIFIMEMLLKIYVYRKAFFKNGWNVFDFIVVAVSSVPYASSLIVLRTFRVFRLFKFLDHFPSLNNLVGTFIKLLPNFISFIAVEAVIFYSFAVIGVSLYGDVFKNFATLGSSLFVLMQAFTLDGWASLIARPVMIVFPDAWLYFVSFILLSFLIVISFVMNAITTVMDHLKK